MNIETDDVSIEKINGSGAFQSWILRSKKYNDCYVRTYSNLEGVLNSLRSLQDSIKFKTERSVLIVDILKDIPAGTEIKIKKTENGSFGCCVGTDEYYYGNNLFEALIGAGLDDMRTV